MPQPRRIGIGVEQMLPIPICSQALVNVKSDYLNRSCLTEMPFHRALWADISASTLDKVPPATGSLRKWLMAAFFLPSDRNTTMGQDDT